MPAPDPSNVLFKIAHPDLYERNPFNVLNLPVDATAKDIRRRKEDIEAAFDAGTEAEEFRNMLPGDDDRKMPTRAEVEQLFSVLEDPEKRIAYSLFWFWPDSSETPGGGRRLSNPNGEFGHSSVIAKWEEKARGSSAARSSPTVAKHNLAVFHHMMGLAYELALRKYNIKTADTPADVPQHWKAAIYWWNDVSGQADFWHAVSGNVSALADPRLDNRFACTLRDQFAFAFDQINVELAIDFAKRGREADAKRQVEYMKLSQPDSDDVEGVLDNAFVVLLRQAEMIVNAACNEAQAKPENGLLQAKNILSQTDEALRVSRMVLAEGVPIRNAITSVVFNGVYSCLISFSDKTHDWNSSLEFSTRLLSIAETPEQVQRVTVDRNLLAELAHIEEIRKICWGCNKKIDPDEGDGYKEVKLWGNMTIDKTDGQVRFQTMIIKVPACHLCKDHLYSYAGYPEIKSALVQGWKIGDEPSSDDIRRFVETSTLRGRAAESPPADSKGCLIPVIAFGWLIGSMIVGLSKRLLT